MEGWAPSRASEITAAAEAKSMAFSKDSPLVIVPIKYLFLRCSFDLNFNASIHSNIFY
jgi:hypothetical protein